MWKPLAILGLIALSTSAQAREINLTTVDHEQCSTELNYAVRVGPDFFETREDNGGSEILVRYQSPAQLIIAGKTVDLDDRQQQLMRDYQSQLHGTGREILLLTLEAVDVALNAMSAGLTALAGSDHPKNIELQQTSEEILRRTEERLNREGEVYLLGDPGIDDFIEEAIEPHIEELAMESAGTMAWLALKAVFTGGRSIEYEAEEAAEKIEREVERQAKNLERRAEGLCARLEGIDRLEREVHKSIPALAPYDIVKIK